MKRTLIWPWELIPLLALFGWLYVQTMPPGISSWIVEGWDSAMLQVVGSTWGIPHSPGYPIYTILANMFVRVIGIIPGLMDSDVAWRVSLWSTTTSLLTLVFLYLIVRKLARDRTAAIMACALLGVSFVFWRAAIMAEVYSLNVLIFAATFWLALMWDSSRRRGWLIALGVAVGVAVAHHRTAFILPPTIALWVWLKKRPKSEPDAPPPEPVWRRWLILAGVGILPLLAYLYLPWAAQFRQGETWLYGDASDWNTFWFMVVTREWWGLVEPPATLPEWIAALQWLIDQQHDQITITGIVVGLLGLLIVRRHLILFGPPLFALIFFGTAYQVADLDSMLIPLTLILCIGVGCTLGWLIRNTVTRLIKVIRWRDEIFKGTWLAPTVHTVIALGCMVGAYYLLYPIGEDTYDDVDLSDDWQAVDLVEEVAAIANAGTPLTIIGQDNSVLPDFIYARTVLGHPIEPLSTTTLSRRDEAEVTALILERLQTRRLLIDKESLDLGFLPWVNRHINNGTLLLAPTGHPKLWELLLRPISDTLPPNEPWRQLTPGQFLEGRMSLVAYYDRIIHKRTGCFLRLTLFWQAHESLTQDYFVAVQPLGGETVIDKHDHLGLMRGFLPTSQLRPGEIIRDEVDLLIRQPAALPSINLVVNLYQVRGNEFPTFGEVTLPLTDANPAGCNRES